MSSSPARHRLLHPEARARSSRPCSTSTRHGEPTDVVAVTDELIKTGELQRAGGADYLHTLTVVVPTAANAGYYASIVAERALLRRLVEAGTRIVQMGYSGRGRGRSTW